MENYDILPVARNRTAEVISGIGEVALGLAISTVGTLVAVTATAPNILAMVASGCAAFTAGQAVMVHGFHRLNGFAK